MPPRGNSFDYTTNRHEITVYYVMSHWTIPPVNKFDYWLELHHGLVYRFPVKNTQALIYMLDDDARMVCLWKETLCNNGENEAWFGIVYGQKHKVWVTVLVFLVRTSGTFWDQNWADSVQFSVLQQNHIVYSNSIQVTLLSISSNELGNKKIISCLFVV